MSTLPVSQFISCAASTDDRRPALTMIEVREFRGHKVMAATNGRVLHIERVYDDTPCGVYEFVDKKRTVAKLNEDNVRFPNWPAIVPAPQKTMPNIENMASMDLPKTTAKALDFAKSGMQVALYLSGMKDKTESKTAKFIGLLPSNGPVRNDNPFNPLYIANAIRTMHLVGPTNRRDNSLDDGARLYGHCPIRKTQAVIALTNGQDEASADRIAVIMRISNNRPPLLRKSGGRKP